MGCAPKNKGKAFHPTDDVNASSQGGKGIQIEGSEVDLGWRKSQQKFSTKAPKKTYPKK